MATNADALSAAAAAAAAAAMAAPVAFGGDGGGGGGGASTAALPATEGDASASAPAPRPPPASTRRRPNILITGTPGTGKSCTCELVRELTDFTITNVGEIVRTHEFHAGKDEAYDTFILDEDSEDQLLDFMEPIMVRHSRPLSAPWLPRAVGHSFMPL